ncbi:MAG: hypothetical protein M0R70_05765 [Nitrospirae bacterium]|nr:hypothetical protein [Nitrospirota bacterium]
MNIKNRVEALERKSLVFELPMSSALIERFERAKARSKQARHEFYVRQGSDAEKIAQLDARMEEATRQRKEEMRQFLKL